MSPVFVFARREAPWDGPLNTLPLFDRSEREERALRATSRHERLSGGPAFGGLMPAKGMCPNCGHKMRGPSHLCDPTKVKREQARNAALAKLSQK